MKVRTRLIEVLAQLLLVDVPCDTMHKGSSQCGFQDDAVSNKLKRSRYCTKSATDYNFRRFSGDIRSRMWLEIISVSAHETENLPALQELLATLGVVILFYHSTCQPQLKLKATPLASTFAAEIEGVEFSSPILDDVFHEIEDIANKYGVLIFRGTALGDNK
jgi:hypothetical protein